MTYNAQPLSLSEISRWDNDSFVVCKIEMVIIWINQKQRITRNINRCWGFWNGFFYLFAKVDEYYRSYEILSCPSYRQLCRKLGLCSEFCNYCAITDVKSGAARVRNPLISFFVQEPFTLTAADLLITIPRVSQSLIEIRWVISSLFDGNYVPCSIDHEKGFSGLSRNIDVQPRFSLHTWFIKSTRTSLAISGWSHAFDIAKMKSSILVNPFEWSMVYF